jgi:hypothetical protein
LWGKYQLPIWLVGHHPFAVFDLATRNFQRQHILDAPLDHPLGSAPTPGHVALLQLLFRR